MVGAPKLEALATHRGRKNSCERKHRETKTSAKNGESRRQKKNIWLEYVENV